MAIDAVKKPTHFSYKMVNAWGPKLKMMPDVIPSARRKVEKAGKQSK